MSEQNVEQKVVEILDALQNGVAKVGDYSVQYAPDMADAILGVIRLTGADSLLKGLFGGLVLYACYRLFKWAYVPGKDVDDYEPAFVVFGGSALVGASLFGGIIVMNKLFTVWTYAAIFAPKLWLANELLSKVIK